MRAVVRVLQDLGLLLIRVSLAAVVILHGWRRYRTLGLDSQVAYLREAGLPYPDLLAYGATALEVVGGLLLVFGLFTPLVALALTVEHVAIMIIFKWRHGLWVGNGGYELTLMIACAALALTVFGAGRLGIDALFRRPADESAVETT